MKTKITESVNHRFVTEDESYARRGDYSLNGNHNEITRIKWFKFLIWIPYAIKAIMVSTDNQAYANCPIGNYIDNNIYFKDNWKL